MALTKTWPTQDPAGAPITDTRRNQAGLVAKNAAGTPRPGIFPAHTNALVTGRADMAYDVASFFAATSRLNDGVEQVANNGVTVVPTTAAPGSNSRIDVIWVRARFLQHADGSNLPEFGVTQGVAAAVPTKPAIPAGALELATAVITSTTTTTATAVITQTHPYTAAAGGVVWLRNSTEQAAWAPTAGSVAFRLDTARFMDRVGSTWVTRGAACHVRMSANGATSPSANTFLAVGWDTEDLDTDGFHDNVTNNTRLTAPVAGIYVATAKLRYGSTVNAGGVGLGKNGAADMDTEVYSTPNSFSGSVAMVTKVYQLNAGDYVEVFSKGQAASLLISADRSYGELVRIG